MRDSLNYFNAPLNQILKDYKCDTQKGVFPHGFMNEERLDYIGNKPDYKYFQNEFTKKTFSEEEYNIIPNEN
jgi:hypothetical protein